MNRTFKNKFNINTQIVVYIGIFIFFVVFILINSPIVQHRFAHDVPYILDGAWRLHHGQVPHNDFSSVLGYAFLFQQYVFLELFNYNMAAFAISSIALTALAIVIFFCLIKYYKFDANGSWVLRSFIFLLILSLGLGQYHLGTGFLSLTYANLYNRYCLLVLLILLLILVTLSTSNLTRKNTIMLVSLSALLINYLFFSKVTYAIAAGMIVVLFTLLHTLTMKKLVYLTLLTTVIAVLSFLISGINLKSFIADYKAASDVRTGLFITKDFLVQKFGNKYPLLLILTFGAFVVHAFFAKKSYKILLLLGGLAVTSVFLHFTNYGDKDIVFLTFIPCLFISSSLNEYRKLVTFKIFTAASLIFVFENVGSIFFMPKANTYANDVVKSNQISGLYVHHADGYCNDEYADKLMKGAALINGIKQQGERVLTFGFENPFPVLTNTVPPKNTLLVWQYGTTFSDKVYPAAKDLFADASLVVIPKCHGLESSLLMVQLYQNQITNNFSVAGEDEYWVVYRKIKPVE